MKKHASLAVVVALAAISPLAAGGALADDGSAIRQQAAQAAEGGQKTVVDDQKPALMDAGATNRAAKEAAAKQDDAKGQQGGTINPAVKAGDEAAKPTAAKGDLEAAVGRWVSEHPDEVKRILERAAADKAAAERAAAEDRVAPTAASVVDKMDEAMGVGNGDVTVVAFIDRNDPASRSAVLALAALASSDPKIDIYIKELPLINEGSVAAAKAAVAVRKQDPKAARLFEAALLTSPLPLAADALSGAALKAGVDHDAWIADQADPSVMGYLVRTRDLASKIGLNGTPAFLVGKKALVGVQRIEVLRAAVAAERSGAK
jgi:protein-disulfide isomerase